MYRYIIMPLALFAVIILSPPKAWCSTFTAGEIDYVLKNFAPIMRLNKYESYKMDDPDRFFEMKYGQASSGYLDESDYKSDADIYERQNLPIANSADVMTDFDKLAQQPITKYGLPLHFWITIDDKSLKGKQSAAVPLVTIRQNGDLLYIQYWFFYPYNGPGRSFVRLSASGNKTPDWDDVSIYNPQFARGTHYGDWEHVTLRVRKNGAGLLVLSGLFLSRHDFSPWYSEATLKKDFQFIGTHPVIYIAADSHAHYPRADVFIYHEEMITDKNPFIKWPTKFTTLGKGEIFLDLVDFTTDGGDQYDTSMNDKRSIKIISSNIHDKPAGNYAWYPYKYRWGQYKYNVANFSFLKGAFIDEEAASGPSGPIDHAPDDITFAEADPAFSFGWPGKEGWNVEVFASSENFEATPCCMLRHNGLNVDDGKWKGWSYSFNEAPPTTQVATGTTGSKPRNIEVFAITADLEPTGSGKKIIHNFWDGKAWHGWDNAIAPDPGQVDLITTAQNDNGNLEVFAVTLTGKLLHSYFDGNWHPWVKNFQSAPSNIDFISSGTSKDGNLEVFAIADGVLYHNFFDGTWHDWSANFDGAQSMTSVATGRPAFPVMGKNLEVFGVGLDGHVYHDFYDGNWHGWTKDFDGYTKAVNSISVVSGTNIEVFGVDPSGTLQHDFFDGNWHGWTADFPPGAPRVKAVSGMWHGHVELFAVTEFSDAAFTYLDSDGWHPWINPFTDSSSFVFSHPSAYMVQFVHYVASIVTKEAGTTKR